MLLLFALSCGLGLILLLISYFLKIKQLINNETARKLVHFAHALTVAGWPIFLGYWFVIIAELIFVAAVLASQEYRIFHSLRNIDRKTWGEFFFPLGVIVLALLVPPFWVFASALILLGLADGVAALIGKSIKSYGYSLFGHKKTVAGSLAFYLVALFVMLFAVWVSANQLTPLKAWATIITVPLLTTLIENISPYGSDNFTVPLAVYVGLVATGVI